MFCIYFTQKYCKVFSFVFIYCALLAATLGTPKHSLLPMMLMISLWFKRTANFCCSLVLTYILTLASSSQNGESPQELVKFGVECLEIDSWVRRRQYSIIRESLGSGTNTHLQENPLLRDIFGLGAPLVTGPGGHKRASKTERVSYVMHWYWAIPLINYSTFDLETFPGGRLYT